MSHGTILHLQRLSTEDGPGIRTTVFFKGCPLNCQWCHNPESIAAGPEVQWLETRCIGCNICLKVCPQHGIHAAADGRRIDRQRCTACGICVEDCPANALEMLGVQHEAAALVEELLKDRVYFDKSGGGVTLSGGEPTAQPAFTGEVLRRLKQAGVATALDTCGLVAPAVLEALLPDVDLILYDLKLADPQQHRRYTGAGNERILANLLWLRQHLDGRALWLRTPLIPGASATQDNLTALSAWIAANLDGAAQRWELCAFNNLCRDKYRRLERNWEYAATPLMSAAELEQARRWALAAGLQPEFVSVTGAAKVEN